MKEFTLCVVVFFLFCKLTYCAGLISPCPQILKYDEQRQKDTWTARLELRDSDDIEGVRIHILLDSKADILIHTFGVASTNDNQTFVINKSDFSLARGDTFKFIIIVQFNPEKPIPNVISIKLNGIEICSNNITSPVVTEAPLTRIARAEDVNIQYEGICGIKSPAQLLLDDGKYAEGYWPWNVAIMLLRNNKFNYHCGGTLISKDYVLTVAHCVTQIPTKKLLKEMVALYLGTNHLEERGPFFKLSLVSEIHVHTDFDPGTFHNDIALIKLSGPLKFNDFIRPVCLWNGELDINNMIGQAGTVVGWGINNTDDIPYNLMEAKLPIVGLSTCLYHDRTFFSKFTSQKTYCAGGLGIGSTVCRGQSGSGMVFPRPGTSGNDTIWQIRGLVSVTPPDPESVCNTKSYAVFTDVAQHLSWIKDTADISSDIVAFTSATPEQTSIAPKCGRQSPIIVEPLILGGENTTEGEWPWHTAIYKNEIGTLKYICGGTLLSNSYIVTAAHCVTDPVTGDAERSNKFMIYTGTTRINNFSPNAQTGQVSQIRIFPEYTPENFHNDIAVIKTLKPFQYTDYVKPICLWKDDDGLNKVVGTLGTVAGWGFDKNQKLSTALMKTRIPIVDTLTCIYSYTDFFGKFISPTSFCAGFRNDTGVCNGDSGSGMVISKSDKDGQLTWYLRGLVSVSVRQRDTRQCDPSHYVLFTDVAKYTSWITKIIG